MPQALLVMDLQNGIVARLADGAAIVAAAGRALEAARSRGVPVLFVRVGFRPGYPEIAAANRMFTAIRQSENGMLEADETTRLHPALQPRPDEPVIVKRRVSAFSGSDLAVLLRGAGADSLVLTGISTSGVVLSTLREAADLDFDLTVLEDACGDADPEVHRVLTQKVFPRQATVATTDAWIAQL